MATENAEGRTTRLSLGPVGSTRRRVVFFAVSGAILLGILILFREVMTPFLLALILAYVLAPLVDGLERIKIGTRKLPRWVAVVLLYIALLGVLAGALVVGLPRLVGEGQRLAREAPRAVQTVQEDWIPRVETLLAEAGSLYGAAESVVAEAPAEEAIRTIVVEARDEGGYEVHLPSGGFAVTPTGENAYRISVTDTEDEARFDLNAILGETLRDAFRDTEAYAGTALRGVQSAIGRVVGGIFSFFIMLMLSAYMLITRDQIRAFFRSLARPDRRHRFDDLVMRIDSGLAGVVRGQLLIALVNGILSGIGFWLADLRYWPILTLIATVLSIIPIFGAIISSVPAVIVGMQDGVWTAVFVLAWIIGIHQIEANLLNPKIMGDAAKVHPVLVVFALIAGEHLFGIVGALLAVPILSIAQSVFLHVREVALGVPKDPALAAEWAEATLDRPPAEPPEPE